MIRNVVAVAILAVMSTSLQASEAMPLDLAFSRNQIVNGERPALSADGRWFAYEVRTPLVKTPDVAGEAESRFLPNGMPAFLAGIHLFVADVKSGESRAVCEAPASCWRASWSPDNRRLAYYSDAGGEIGVWLYDAAAHRSHRLGTARIKAKLWPGDVARWSPDGKLLYVLLPPPPPATAAKPRRVGAEAAPAAVTVYRTAAKPSCASPARCEGRANDSDFAHDTKEKDHDSTSRSHLPTRWPIRDALRAAASHYRPTRPWTGTFAT